MGINSFRKLQQLIPMATEPLPLWGSKIALYKLLNIAYNYNTDGFTRDF